MASDASDNKMLVSHCAVEHGVSTCQRCREIEEEMASDTLDNAAVAFHCAIEHGVSTYQRWKEIEKEMASDALDNAIVVSHCAIEHGFSTCQRWQEIKEEMASDALDNAMVVFHRAMEHGSMIHWIMMNHHSLLSRSRGNILNHFEINWTNFPLSFVHRCQCWKGRGHHFQTAFCRFPPSLQWLANTCQRIENIGHLRFQWNSDTLSPVWQTPRCWVFQATAEWYGESFHHWKWRQNLHLFRMPESGHLVNQEI